MLLKEKIGLAEPLYLMDGTAFIYRGFYAGRPLQRSDGFPTNALLIVSRVILKILKEEQPKYFLFVMDGKGKTFRHELYEQYKANREAMPEDLARQIEPIKEMVSALGAAVKVSSGFEADDCIASLAARFCNKMPVVIISGDKDLKQCLGKSVVMWDPGAKEERLLDEEAFILENGVTPAQWPDFQALVGDSSDNIPGVPGIGPKSASQIFEICANLEEIRDHLDRLPQKFQAKLIGSLEDMFLWRDLTTLCKDKCGDLTLEDMRLKPINRPECVKIADEYELSSIRREIESLVKQREEERHGLIASKQEAKKEPLTDPFTGQFWETGQLAELPDCQGHTVAVIWPELLKGSPRLALCDSLEKGLPESGRDILWTGKMSELCRWLGGAGEIVTNAIKPLLIKFPSWRKLIPIRHIDLSLAAYLLNPEDGDYSFKRILGRWQDSLSPNLAGPAMAGLELGKILLNNLRSNELEKLYYSLELPLTPILAKMEERGIAIDPRAFKAFLMEVDQEAEKLAEIVYNACGEKFNIRSSQQLGEILFDKLHLGNAKKTRTGQYSTSQAALEKLVGNPVVDSVLQFRKLDKMRSTYLDPLPRLMDAHDRLHTTFNQDGTATGRLSSSNPNLQNIPVKGPLGKRIRSCFIASKDKLLLAADYSQIELRILAFLSQDQALLEAFHAGVDIHTRTAALIFDLDADVVSNDQRRMAKTINFGLLYGMGARKLSQELKITATEAQDFINRYFSRLSQLNEFYRKIIEKAREQGYVTTMAGRRRWLPGLYSANGQTVAQAERQAVNTVIQGSAADIIKLAMLAVERDEELERQDARLVLQIHDELLLESPEEVADAACARVAWLMENVRPGGIALSVPLKVDWGIGKNWGAAH